MSKWVKLIQKILSGTSDRNFPFDDMVSLLLYFGFEQRIKGSHHIFFRTDIEEIINIQPVGNHAKLYQVKQVRNLILKYQLGDRDE